MPINDTSPVPHQRILYAEFQRVRDQQASNHRRQLTEINRQAARVIFETGVKAVLDVHQFDASRALPQYLMRVASLGTGSGKSTSAVALIAAYCRLFDGQLLPREHFSAAFVVPTVQLAKEVHSELQALMPAGEKVAMWTREESNTPKSHLSEHRVVVLCHQSWLNAMTAGREDGFRFYQGGRRKLVFVDEQPELVKHVHLMPRAIQELFEDVQFLHPEHPVAPVLRQLVAGMNGLVGSIGQRFQVADDLLTREDGSMFRALARSDLVSFIRPEVSGDARLARVAALEELKDFLVAASQGGCFYSRQTQTFTAYRFDFDPGPGHVLLDATADISGLTQLRSDIAHVPVPVISYRRLETVLVEIPKRWRRVRDLLTKLDRGEALEFGEWVRAVIVDNTNEGDDVLTYAKLALYQAHILDKAPDPAAPLDLQGRKVNTEHHGTGVGRNVWKSKNVVALIGDHFLPRNVTIATTHGWSGQTLSNGGLKQAEGNRVYGDVFRPEGVYGNVHEGHALRWMKQESMRGSAREIGDDGVCGPMKLIIFTGDTNLVIRNWTRLYPGAPLPRSYVRTTPEENSSLGCCVDGDGGFAGLTKFLMTTDAFLVDGQVIKERFGIRPCDLPRALKSPACREVATAYGWSVTKAKHVNKPGRGNWLVRWQQYAMIGHDDKAVAA